MDVQQQVSCSNPVLGDPEHGYYKQCFCQKESPTGASATTTSMTEAPASVSINVCANEGQTCQCTGRVYYGRRVVNGQPGYGEQMTFEQMQEFPFETRDVQQQVGCGNSAL